MRIAKRAAIALVVVLLLSVCSTAGASNYSVRPIPPPNQADQEAWYYDFTVVPGEELVLRASILNMGSEEIQVEVEANAASTNSNGLIQFVKTEEKDPSLTVDFGAICVPIEPIITIPPMSEGIAEFMLTVPEEPFEGILYGGFLFTKLDQVLQGEQGAMGITNIYRYAIGARIRENPENAPYEFELNGAELDQTDIPALVLNLRNPAPALARGIDLVAEVYPEGADEPIETFRRSNVEIAPNTAMAYRLELYERGLPEAGHYRLVLHLTLGEQEWTFETPLTVA